MEKNKELSISLQNEIKKQSLDSEFKKKFDECFLDFNDFNNLRCKATFHAYYTKYHWYGERHLFTKEHVVKNDFFDKFYLGVRNDAPNKKEAYGDLEIQAVVDCLNDGWLAGFGPRTIEFEEKVSSIFSKKYGLFVKN